MRVFGSNPRRRTLGVSDAELAAICSDGAARFAEYPIYHTGESTEIRHTPAPGLLIQRMIPPLNSITSARKGIVAGTERLRLASSPTLWAALHREGLATCHLACDGDYVLISEERVPPIEVIVKAAFVGTPTRIYHGLAGRTDRFGQRIAENCQHAPYVRFDYRNPLRGPAGASLRDECMPEALADRLIDTRAATRTALAVFAVVRSRLARVGLDVWDACFLFDATGEILCYEISPDNMRIKSAGWANDPQAANEFDKDLWRRGTDTALLAHQWRILAAQLLQVEAEASHDG